MPHLFGHVLLQQRRDFDNDHKPGRYHSKSQSEAAEARNTGYPWNEQVGYSKLDELVEGQGDHVNDEVKHREPTQEPVDIGEVRDCGFPAQKAR